MIGDALALTLHDLLIGVRDVVILAGACSLGAGAWFFLYVSPRRKREEEKERGRQIVARELREAEREREAAIRVVGPLPQTEWDADHATRTSVGRRV